MMYNNKIGKRFKQAENTMKMTKMDKIGLALLTGFITCLMILAFVTSLIRNGIL